MAKHGRIYGRKLARLAGGDRMMNRRAAAAQKRRPNREHEVLAEGVPLTLGDLEVFVSFAH